MNLRRMPAERLARATHPKLRRFWNKRRRFLGQFVERGDVVFDVGANIGDYTQTFAELGATTIALEPVPGLAEAIQRRVPSARVLDVAASATEGQIELWLGHSSSDATASLAYANVLRTMLHFNLRPVTVRTVTLDQLAADYGVPSFVKTDVEGHEPDVLRGMSFLPAALSIEVHCSLPNEASESLSLLSDRGYIFRLARGFSNEWSGPWQKPNLILDQLSEIEAFNPNGFADVYAVRS